MTAVGAVIAGMLLAAGVVLALPGTRLPARRRRARPGLMQRVLAVPRRVRLLAALGLAGGFAAALLSGVLLLVVVVPVAVVGLPLLLGRPDTRERDLLSAVESWTRGLAAGSVTGRLTLREVISVTRTAAPPAIRPAVERLHTRMATTWTTSRALRAFATELDSAWVDEVTVYLIQAADYSAGGLAQALDAIAGNLATQVKLRADVYRERERPRRVMVQIVWITAATLTLVVLFARTPQLAAYSTPLGQVLLAVVLTILAALLLWARHIGRPRPEPRFLLVGERS